MRSSRSSSTRGSQPKAPSGERPAGKASKRMRGTKNLRETVAQGVRVAIMVGQYPPGSPLGEADLAERFGVSRGPVREALIQLEKEYLVRSYPNRGVFVTALTEHEFDERVRLRSVLEPMALEGARERATPGELGVIREHLHRLEATAATGDQAAYLARDYEFHLAIWDVCGSPLLKDMLVQISAPVFVFEGIVADRYRRAAYDIVSDARAHQGIMDYLTGKTGLGAECCLRPVLELAMRAERSVVFGSASTPRPVRRVEGE